MKYGFSAVIAIIIVVIIVAIPIAFFYGKNISKTSNNSAGPVTVNTINEQKTPQPSPVHKGIITGRVGYPSEFIPKGRVQAQNISTKEVFSTNVEGLIAGKGSNKFSITVAEGQYYLKYEACPSPQDPNKCLDGYYTTNDGTSNNPTHDLIPVKVSSGETVKDIYIFDFYGSPSTNPGF